MAKRLKSAASWSNAKAVLKNWPPNGLVGLLRELYDLSDENRTFLQARLLPDKPEVALAAAKRKLRQSVSVSAVFNGRFKHNESKRIIDQYCRANDDPLAEADLLVVDLEQSLRTFSEVGNSERLVDHVYASLARLDKVMTLVPADVAGSILERTTALARRWGGEFGYGISDELCGYAEKWNERGRS